MKWPVKWHESGAGGAFAWPWRPQRGIVVVWYDDNGRHWKWRVERSGSATDRDAAKAAALNALREDVP